MNTPTRITTFVALLALVFAGAAFAGSQLDPGVEEKSGHEDPAVTHSEEAAGHDAATSPDAEHGESHGAPASATPPGLASEAGGLRLVVADPMVEPVPGAPVEFAVVGRDGRTVREFDVTHERRMHLIVVRRDFQGFQHLHPDQRPDGSWEVELDEAGPGTHRMFADFSTGGKPLTLATDLLVPGDFEPRPLGPARSTASAGDGYEVTIDSPPGRAGETIDTEFEIRKAGEPVAVQPYLGADGHLVALREGDQAFLHTHPEGRAGGEGPIRFGVTYPSVGRYRLYLQFRHAGEVRTAEFTRVAGPEPRHGGDDHGH